MQYNNVDSVNGFTSVLRKHAVHKVIKALQVSLTICSL